MEKLSLGKGKKMNCDVDHTEKKPSRLQNKTSKVTMGVNSPL
jgi:hypothetical protein